LRIRIETEAKLFIQENILIGNLQLAWSYILDYENAANPYDERKEVIANWEKHAIIDTDETESILEIAVNLNKIGIKTKDALHLACSIELKCEYFITTDLILIKKLANFDQIRVISPNDFINSIK
jgi:predicted nucleic acid-binding protein